MKPITIIQTAAIFGILAVGIGAFGAHGLKPMLEASGRLETFETAVKYHFYHSLALFGLGLLAILKPNWKKLNLSFWGFTLGIFIFSGSLYLHCLTGITWLGVITPIGGVAFIQGWMALFWGGLIEKKSDI
ncbi:DUF423 domain-containing protein [Algoriphagus sp. A40]|uniref:DUF423 domain-containing protein n=1 Tax=Algoriphagus sp. A40 TaxID=1945863 RepID=UPI0009846A2A|nr:DUF423 domain-containing protein [Algoriphagus sp. A40]OOG71921.1 hypothetical protein B0E43_16710 [Algoriphagus sp. A40]